MESIYLNLSKKDKDRLAYIEGRPDLFATKLLRISSNEQEDTSQKILVSTRDPGSGNALIPVIKELLANHGVQIDVVADGRAKELIEKNFSTDDLTPEDSILAADNIIGTPKVILMDRSTSEMGIDTYVAATFPEVPKVLVEDYYTTATNFLLELIKRNIPLPNRVCVMDLEAKNLIVDKLPQLSEIIEITGQPSFDRFFEEDTEGIAQEVKRKLGLNPADKLVSFMSTIDEPEKIKLLAEALKKIPDDFYFVFRRHPRDNTSYEEYEKILTEAGVKLIGTDNFSTDEIGAASDVVLTTWSTEGLNGIYRRKPTVHIINKDFRIPESLTLPLPPVKLGASIGVDNIDDIETILPKLLDSNSDLSEKLKVNMAKYYPADGQNSKRVADIVRDYLK